MFRVFLVIAAVLLACNGNKARPGPPEPDEQAAAKCDALRDKVAGLYKEALEEPVEGEVDDNTHMILDDCRKDPAKFAPCIEAATSAAQLESECVIPLDDEGKVEATQFK